jgi:hypothetical protein
MSAQEGHSVFPPQDAVLKGPERKIGMSPGPEADQRKSVYFLAAARTGWISATHALRPWVPITTRFSAV